MTEPQPRSIIFIPELGELPDAFTDAVNALPRDLALRPRIAPWSGTVDQGTADVEGLLDREELRRIILVGAGRGAAVALRIAATQPHRVTGLVLDSPVTAVDGARLKGVSAALKITPGFLFRRRNKRELLEQVADLGQEQTFDSSRILAPTLIITGGADPTAGVAQLRAELPDARQVSIAGAGRLTYRTHAPAFGAAIGDFLPD